MKIKCINKAHPAYKALVEEAARLGIPAEVVYEAVLLFQIDNNTDQLPSIQRVQAHNVEHNRYEAQRLIDNQERYIPEGRGLTNTSDIELILEEMDSETSFDPDNHMAVSKAGLLLNSVTSQSQKMGYFDDESKMSEETKAKGRVSSTLGTLVHSVVEVFVKNYAVLSNGNMSNPRYHQTLPPETQAEIARLRKQFTRSAWLALTQADGILDKAMDGVSQVLGAEQIVTDNDTKTFGIIDLLVQDIHGNIKIIDTKTKIAGGNINDTFFSVPIPNSTETTMYRYDATAKQYFSDATGTYQEITEAEFLAAQRNATETYKSTYKRTFSPWKWFYESRKGAKHSHYAKYAFQQLMYKRMLAKRNIDVQEMSILPLQMTVVENSRGELIITSMEVTESLPTRDNGTILLEPTYTIQDDVNDVLNLRDHIDPTPVEFFDDLRKKVLNIKQAIAKRASTLGLTGKKTQEEALTKGFTQADHRNILQLVLDLVGVANNELRRSQEDYNRLIRGKNFDANDIELLGKLREYDNMYKSFRSISEFRDFFADNPNEFLTYFNNDMDMYYQLSDILNTTVAELDKFKSIYTVKGGQIFLNILTQNSSYYEASERYKLEKEYRKDFIQRNRTTGKRLADQGEQELMDTWVDNKIKAMKEDTSRNGFAAKQKSFLKNLMSTTEKDIGFIERIAHTVFSTPDIILGTVMKQFQDSLMVANKVYMDSVRDMMDVVKEYEKTNHGTGSFADNKKLYGKLIDESTYGPEGKPIFRIVSKFTNEFLEARRQMMRDVRNKHNDDDIAIAVAQQAWMDKHAPIDPNDMDTVNAKMDQEFDDLLAADAITQAEYDLLTTNKYKLYPSSFRKLATTEHGTQGYAHVVLNRDIADHLTRTRNILEDQYRVQNTAIFKNDKYDYLMSLPESHVDRKMWQMFKDLGELGDTGVAVNSLRLNGRIPGMTKSMSERVVGGENVLSSVWKEVKNTVGHDVNTYENEAETAARMGNEANEEVDFVPIHFTKAPPVEDQSFDLPTIYNMWLKSALNYQATTKVLPIIQFGQDVLANRTVTKTDGSTKLVNALINVFNRKSNVQVEESSLTSKQNNVSQQFNDWIQMVVYQRRDHVPYEKMARFFQGLTSFSVMAFNVYAMVSNVSVGEAQRAISVVGGKLADVKSYTWAKAQITKEMPSILADVGKRVPESKANLLLFLFGLDDELIGSSLHDKSLVKKLLHSSTTFWNMNSGETWMKMSYLYAVLKKEHVFDNDGNDLGSIIDHYSVVDGKLTLSPEGQSFIKEERIASMRRKIRHEVIAMDGNYWADTKTALQMNYYTSFIEQFRKWVIPSIYNRFHSRHYSEVSESFESGYVVEGFKYYKHKMRYGYEVFRKFMGKQQDEMKMLDLYSKANWDSLTRDEQIWVRKAQADALILTALLIISSTLSAIDWDDDEPWESHVNYQLQRLITEMGFYYYPKYMLTIIKSPVAMADTVDKWIDLAQNIVPWNIMDTYENGDNKALRRTMKTLPLIRQMVRFSNPSEQIKALTPH